MFKSDAALVIAPEVDGILEQRCRWVQEAGCALLGPKPDAVRLTADKLALAEHFFAHGIPTPVTRTLPLALERPDVRVVHVAFQVMVACGMAMVAVALWGAWAAWRGRSVPDGGRFLAAVVLASPLGMLAVEAGWIVTEVGRQPWAVVGYLLTRDAVARSGNLWLLFAATLALYAAVGAGTFYVLGLLRRRWSEPGDGEVRDDEVPYGPSRAEEPLPGGHP